MKKIIFVTIFVAFIAIFSVKAFAQGNNLSDYQYQLDQYRSNYSEFQILKNDYLAHSTLNNEQKAILSAKQTLSSRELTLSYYFLVLVDSIKSSAVDYPLVNTALNDLNDIAQFHFSESVQAGKIVTRQDLTAFTTKYSQQVAKQADIIARSQIANKIAQLIHLQQESKRAYDALLPSLQTKIDDVNVQNGIGQVQSFSQQINDQISALTQKASSISVLAQNSEQLYQDAQDTLSQIRAIQVRLINIIIDLDTNYANH